MSMKAQLPEIPDLPSIETVDVYPHVVVRWQASVYGCKIFRFEGEPRSGQTLGVACHRDAPDARDKMLDRVHGLVLRFGLRMCVVFGPKEVCYLEPDGTRKLCDERPSGGIRYDGPDPDAPKATAMVA